jgi:hypothetical protein
MEAVWSPLTTSSILRQQITEVLAVLRDAGQLHRSIPVNPTLLDVHNLGQQSWVAAGRQRWNLPAVGQELESALWPLFQALGLVEHQPPYRNFSGTFCTWGSAGPVWRKMSFINGQIVMGTQFGTFYDMAGDRKLERDGVDGFDRLLNVDNAYGTLSLVESPISPDIPSYAIATEADMVRWAWEQAAWARYPGRLVRLDSDRSDGTTAAEQGVRAWAATDPVPGHYAVLTTGPHFPFHANDFNRLVDKYAGPGFTVQAIGPRVGLGWVPNSVAQCLDGLARAINSYLELMAV